MNILGIETSCDETAIAVVRDGHEVLTSLVSSQIAIHAPFGGVVPEIAARHHLEAIYPIFSQAMEEARLNVKDIDAIAVSQGPGLIGALLVGASFAKAMAQGLNIPLIPVNHVHAHVHGALLSLDQTTVSQKLFPTLAFVVSGGHTNLYYMENANDFGLVAATIDDACGECFDKVAKLLGFSYPGGPAIERQAAQGDPKRFPMPKMMEQKSQLHFSYSGLKTHVNYLLKKIAPLNQQDCRDVCASFQDEAFAQITRKLKLALQKFPKAKSVVIAGGVAANKAFQGMLAEHCDLTVYFPNLAYCSDNAAMIAACGWYQWQAQPDAAIYRSPYAWDAFSRYDFAGNTRHEIE